MNLFFRKSREEEQVIIYIYESEITIMNEEVSKYPDRETGGDLFGTFTHANMPVIWLATGPGPKAKRSTVEFEQDIEFRSQWQNKLMKEYGIQFVGSWHSHHQLGLDRLSGGDMQASESYLLRHNRSVTVEVIATIEASRYEVSLKPYYHLVGGAWVLGAFSLLQGTSPIREKLDLSSNKWKTRLHEEKNRPGFIGIQGQNNTKPDTASLDVSERVTEGHYTMDEEERPRYPYKQENSSTILVKELTELALDVEYDKRDNKIMLILPLGEQVSLAIVVEDMNYFIKVFQANIISKAYGINQDITDQLYKDGLLLKTKDKDAYQGSVKLIYRYARNYAQKSLHFSF